MLTIDYLTDQAGQPKAVVIPIELWRLLFPEDDEISAEAMVEAIEDYCLGKAMNEAKDSPLLLREEALAYLLEEE